MARPAITMLLVCLVACVAPARAAGLWEHVADPVFVHVDTRALPEAAVMSLTEDAAGFVWVGTQGGLARYDGYRFRTFSPDPADPDALPDGYIRALAPADDGGVWIGSSSDGLVHFDAATETFHTFHPDASGIRGPRSTSVDAIVPAGGAGWWIGGDGGLDRFDPVARRFGPVSLATRGQQPVVWCVLVDRSGAVWAGTQTGLYVRPPGAVAFRPFPLPGTPGAAPPVISSLMQDRAGRLWAGSVNALFGFDENGRAIRVLRSRPEDPTSLAPGQQWSIAEPVPDRLWVGTDGALSIVDTATLHVRRVEADPSSPHGLTGGRVVQILRDRSGMIWLANHIGGLLLYNPMSRGVYQLSNSRPEIGLGDEGAVALAARGGNRLWIGGFHGRLVDFDATTGRSQAIDVPNRAAVQALIADDGGTLWIGTTNGVCRLAPAAVRSVCPTEPAQLATPSVYALLIQRGRLYVGGSTGLFVDDLTTKRVSRFPSTGAGAALANGQVRTLFLDRRERLWVGTESGLDRIDPDGRFVAFRFAPGATDSIGPGGMASVMEDRRGRMWAGANGGPLDVLSEDAAGRTHVVRIGRADGMPHENVDGVAEDPSGRIWASTDKGIAAIDPDTLRPRAYGLADGVTDSAFWAGTVSQSADGTIFFGGLDGVTIVTPNARSTWAYAPPLVATAITVGRRSVSARDVNRGGATLEVPPDSRDFSVEFSALDFSAPQMLRYQYRLDGEDRDWVDADAMHRVATYTHLAPGRYTLEIRGTNRLGVWSDRVLRIGVDVAPAWFETWWFRVLVAALVLLAAYGVYRLRTAVLRRRQRELESLVSERTAALSLANARLVELSLSDPLTGLRNRRFLDQHLESDIVITQRRYEDWCADRSIPEPVDADILFFLIDLDNFKLVNDRFGHNAGDAVLMHMRERLQEVFRESDFVVRWGGDEFLTVARGTKRSDAPMLAERIRAAVEQRPFALGGEVLFDATASVGFAAFPFVPSEPGAVTWYQAVGLADHALYMAKQAGRNAWFGVAAGPATDTAVLLRHLEGSAEELVQSAALIVIREPRP